MKILSWDVGIHHLSYCILERNDEFENEEGEINNKISIRKWGIIDLAEDPIQKKNMTYIFENIPRKLDEIPELLSNIDIVCIENQPTLKNPTMKTIQVILYSYFLIRGKTDNKEYPVRQISFISATNKLKVYQGPYINPDLYTKSGKLKNEPKSKKVNNKNQPLILEFLGNQPNQDNLIEAKPEEEIENLEEVQEGGKKASAVCYGDKKKLAILYTREMIKKDHVEYLEYFEGNKKKDDLSDSYLQGMYVLLFKNPSKKNEVEEKTEEKKKKVTKPRKKKGGVLDVIEKIEKKEEKEIAKQNKQPRKRNIKKETQNLESEGVVNKKEIFEENKVEILEDNNTKLEVKKQPRKRRTKEEIKKEKEDSLVNKAAEKAYLSDSSIDDN